MSLDDFTATLRAEMERASLNQSQLGRQANVAPSMISAWRDGKTRNPEPEKVFAVERALELPGGFLSRHLGYLPLGAEEPRAADIREAIDAAADLDYIDKEAMRGLYRVLRKRFAASETVSDATVKDSSRSRMASSR